MKKRLEVIAALLACSVSITSAGCAGKKNNESHDLKLQSIELGTEKQPQADTKKLQTESQTEQASDVAEETEEKDERIDLLDYYDSDSPEDVIQKAGLCVIAHEGEGICYTGYQDTLEMGTYSGVDGFYIDVTGTEAPVSIGGVTYGMTLKDARARLESCGYSEGESKLDGFFNFHVADGVDIYIEVDDKDQIIYLTLSKEIVEGTDNAQTDTGYIDVYGALVNAVNDTYGSSCCYHLYDIDGNGTPELILLEGTCEADYNYYVYTYEDGNAVQLGTLLGSRLFYEVPDQNGVISVRGKQGYQFVDQITISGDKLMENELFSGEASDDGYYANEYEIPYYYVNDLSGIQ